MNIIHNIYTVGRGSFGLGPVALNLTREQIELGHAAYIWCLDHGDDCQWAAVSTGLHPRYIRKFRTSGPKKLYFSIDMYNAANREAENISIVHQHALWTGLSRITNFLRERRGVPTVVSPHGMLEKWALKHSQWKKKIALTLYERNNLVKSTCLHACSEQEFTGIRDFGLKNPTAIIPNGVCNSWLDSIGDSNAFRERFKLPQDKRIMLFLSRITPVKGLPLLIEALAAVRIHMDDWLLVIAGADEFNHKAEVLGKIKEFRLDKHVVFTGLLVDQIRQDAYAAAELFILPTKRENYGIVVAEALGVGVPVLTTEGAPWAELTEHNCGWWTKRSVEAISEALSDALCCTPDELKHKGQRGKELVAAKYTWAENAKLTVELYKWLLGHRERPDFVVVD